MEYAMLSVFEQYPAFRNSGESRRQRMLAQSSRVNLAADTEVFARSDVCDRVLLVGSGHLRVYTLSPAGREISLYHVSRGETCPVNILSVMLERPASAFARVVTDMQAVTIPAECFRQCVAEDEAMHAFAYAAIADRLQAVIGLVERVTFCTLEQRLADFLCCQFDSEAPEDSPVLALTHDQIASELGSAREVISRLLRDLERRGGVSLGRGHIRVKDINLLKNINKYSQH